MMTLKTEYRNNISIIRLDGKLNIESVIQLDEIMNSLLANSDINLIAVDCKNLSYIDSSALGSWIQYINSTRSLNKEFYLFDIPNNILVIIEMAFLEKFFKCTTSDVLNSKYNTNFFRI